MFSNGLIPAHAGKTTSARQASQSPRAHPRSRGENCPGLGAQVPAWGSSPLTRGKPWTSRRSTRLRGLIPAHAGKTPQATYQALDTRAHPRSRGEN